MKGLLVIGVIALGIAGQVGSAENIERLKTIYRADVAKVSHARATHPRDKRRQEPPSVNLVSPEPVPGLAHGAVPSGPGPATGPGPVTGPGHVTGPGPVVSVSGPVVPVSGLGPVVPVSGPGPHPGPVPLPPPVPKYVPKPFVPRERKPVQKLQPAGPVLYTAPEYKEPRYGGISEQDFSKIPGYPGKDYPLFPAVPETKFTCDQVPHRPGLYADVETGCQAYHICQEDNRDGYAGASFLCTNGTVFNQLELTCDWWYNVNCADSINLYQVNLDPYKNPYITTPEKEAVKAAKLHGAVPPPPQHGVVLPPPPPPKPYH